MSKAFQPVSEVLLPKKKQQSFQDIYGEPENFLEIEVCHHNSPEADITYDRDRPPHDPQSFCNQCSNQITPRVQKAPYHAFRHASALRSTNTQVRNPQTHFGREQYTDYEIFCRTNIPTFRKRQSRLRRRYSDFVALRKMLEQDLSRVVIPPLPGKILLTLNKFNDLNIENRRLGLENFLTIVSGHPLLQTGLRTLVDFLQNERWEPKPRYY